MEDETKSVRRIPFFNPLYPDELLYSACARYSDRVAFGPKTFAMQGLFGDAQVRAVVDLPHRIDYFISILPPGHPYDAEQIIDKHTLFPFYAPFMASKERFNRLRQDMRGNFGVNMCRRAGIEARGILPPGWLRFCPICVEEDRKKLDETYWHRSHQLPGVEACPRHEVFLENSNVRAGRRFSIGFISAQNALTDIPSPCPLDNFNPVHVSILRIARNVLWLLGQDNLEPDLNALRSRYSYLLSERKLASHTGIVRRLELEKAFKEHHSKELLTILQCEVDEQRDNWLRRVLKTKPLICANHPLYHLLLIDFFGYSVEDFLKLPEKFLPFGLGPWPCLNPVCEHYRAPSILEVDIEFGFAGKRVPMGVFKCTCGFTYRRTGPDQSAEDQYRIGVVLSRGPLWEAELKKLWTDSDISLTKILARLKSSRVYTISYAARLNLPFPRRSRTGKPIVHSTTSLNKIYQLKHIEELELYRQQWLSARTAYPNEGRSFMRDNFRQLHYWLNKHDKAWLESNLPAIASRESFSVKGERVDWHARDIELSTQIHSAIERIKSKPGRPTKILLTAIERELNLRSPLNPVLSKLPLTAAEINRGLESKEDFAIRKVWWIFNSCCSQYVRPTRWQLVHKAKINPLVLESAKVQRVLDEVMELFRLQE